MVYFLDTNIFVRIIVSDEKEMTEECERLLEQVRAGQIEAATSPVVLMEVGWLLKSFYKYPRLKIASLLGSISKMRGLTINEDLDIVAALEYYRTTNVSLTDAVIAAIPKIASKEWAVVSYDEGFKKLPVKWQKPGKVLERLMLGRAEAV
mgnify:CR=1 FL=1